MLCENCHRNEATEVVLKPDGEDGQIEVFVCSECARKMRAAASDSDEYEDEDEETVDEEEEDEESGRDIVSEISGDAKDPPPFVKDLLDATLGFIKGAAELDKRGKTKCPGCGRTLAEIASEGVCGCPECWNTFSEEIRCIFLRPQYGMTHVGEPPRSAAKTATRASLERRFNAAMKKQNFRLAAQLKRKLEELDSRSQDASEDRS